ncbi:unnamed protein product [Effrenium voratum]|nr:unnamed protein product [Effrenium voratum]
MRAATSRPAMEGIVVADLSGASIAAPTRVPGDDDPALSAQACLCVVRGSPSEAEPMRYRRCDFVFCRDASLPFVTLQWTGSDGGLFNREMKRIAALRGLHLSNTYICKADRTAQGRQVGEITRAGAKILCKDEREIFEMLGLPYRPPERREVDAELLEAVEEAARQAPEALRLVKMELARRLYSPGRCQFATQPAAAREGDELHELFDRCPAGEKLKTIKPDVNSTAFVTFEDDSAAQDAALWLRSQKLRDCPVKCSIKSEQFLRSFFPMQPVQSYGGPGVPAWASAWSSWAGWGYGGGKEGDVKGKSGPEKGGAFGGSGASGAFGASKMPHFGRREVRARGCPVL